MKKQNKRKGFSAIEMLVVIAVIALLVSVVVPVISNQSVKAKAAANAANLRTIESVVAMKLVEEPDAFEDYFKNGEASNKVDNYLETEWPQKVVDFIFGEGAAESMIKDYYLQFADARTGKTLTIEGTSPQIIISGVALPVAMEAPRRGGGTGLAIGEYDYMSVYICQDGVLAFYNNFTKDDFADVAEDGYYDGAGSAGGVENSGGILGEIQKDVCQAQGKHEPGPGCKCRNCGAEAHVDAEETKILGFVEYKSSTTLHECRCGKVFNAGHIYEGTDHKCKYKKTADEECPVVSPCADLDPEDDGFLGIGGDKEDHKCYLCGGDNNHAWCTTDNKGGGTLFDPLPDHKCDTCGYVMSTCTIKEISYTQHQCTTCEVKSSHNFQNGVCECGAEQKSCKFDGCDRTDVQDDYYCAGHQEKPCDATVMGKTLLGRPEAEKCSGKYRDTIADCSNAGSHAKCDICGVNNVKDDGYCSNHQEKTCKEPVLKSGGGTQNCNTKYRDTCKNAANHHTTHTYVDDPNNATQHKCACNAAEKHNFVNGTCSVCNKTMPTCKFNPCEETNVQSNGYCAEHQEKPCTAKVMGKNWLGQSRAETCSGKYRDTIADCSNTGSHAKCGICGVNNVQDDGHCSSHQEKTCSEKVLKSGGGTQNCNTKYRDTCGNAANHHTTHTYVEVPTDAVKHKCACGATENHNYVNGSCTVCGRSSHSAPNDCVDSNKDHKCDTCGSNVGTHTTNVSHANGTHGCTYCGYSVGCSDTNPKDHKCDTCGYTMSSCSDGNDNNHNCDYCEKPNVTSCGRKGYTSVNDSQHKCNECGAKKNHTYGMFSDSCEDCSYEKPSSGGC